jgi:hypothetical protein
MHLILLLIGITCCMVTNRNLFRRTVLQPKMWESQQLFLGLRLVSRIFEENQQPAIQTKIDSCLQNWDHGLRPATRYTNLKRVAPAVFGGVRLDAVIHPISKKDDKICQTEQTTNRKKNRRLRHVCYFYKLNMERFTSCQPVIPTSRRVMCIFV